MKKSLFALLLVPVFALGQAGPPVPIPFITDDSPWDWDPVTQDIQDQPETVSYYEVAISAAGVDMNDGGVALNTIPVATNSLSGSADLILGVSNGTYAVWCCAVDQAGNRGEWSDPVAVRIDKVPPKKVFNFTLNIGGQEINGTLTLEEQ